MHVAETGIDSIVELDADHVKATSFNMLFMIWRRRTLAGAYRRAAELVRELADSHPEGIGILQVVELEASPPDAETRNLFRDLLGLDGISHFSVTHEGAGFKAAAVRAIVLGAQSLARPQFPHSVHGSLGAAAAWHAAMQRSLGRHEPAATIHRIAQDLRNFHLDRFPS